MLSPLTTPAEFAALPLLLTYSEVLSCGVKRRHLKEYVKSGQITFVQTKRAGRRRYRKSDLAKILGVKA